MNLRIVQRGDPSRLCAAYLVGEQMDVRLRAVLPNWTIVAYTNVTAIDPYSSMLALAGARPEATVILAGWSLGCSRIRSLLAAGARPAAVVCADGTTAHLPPSPEQIDPWRELISRARANEMIAVLTCTSMGYTEKLEPPLGPFYSTKHLLHEVTGFPTQDGPGEWRDGSLVVRSYASKDIDAIAHEEQLTDALPSALGVVLEQLAARDALADTEPAPPATLPTGAADFALAVLDVAKADLTAGIREHGHNAGPEIEKLYLEPLGLPAGSNYCAAAVSSWIRRAELATGMKAPVAGSGGAKALIEQFQAAGRFTPAKQITAAKLYPGMLLFWDRSVPGHPSTEWRGHVGIVVDTGVVVAFTIEANADRPPPCDAVCMVARSLDDHTLLGGGILN
jgi:hypothetical protein